jgi:hypothetical protein
VLYEHYREGIVNENLLNDTVAQPNEQALPAWRTTHHLDVPDHLL